MSKDKNKISFSNGISLYADYQSSDEIPNKIEIMNTKNFVYGEEKISFPKEMLEQCIENFKKEVLGRKVPVNYDHPRFRLDKTIAAGWIKDVSLERMENEVYSIVATIDWNKKGKDSIFNKEYAYTSIGAYINMPDPRESSVKRGFVLYELSLTNDPANINLGSIIELSNYRINGGDMEKEELKKSIDELKENQVALQKKLDKAEEEKAELAKKVKEQEEKAVLDKRSSDLELMVKDNRITPAQKEKAMKLSKEAFEGFLINVPEEKNDDRTKSLSKSDTKVELSKKDGLDEAMDLAEKMVKDSQGKMEISEAFQKVLSENKNIRDKIKQEE